MVAADTNILLRFLTRDDEVQALAARELIASHRVMISLTVLLETEWVLRATYRFSKPAVHSMLSDLVGLPTIEVAEPGCVRQALDWSLGGLDFADALHLAKAEAMGCETFATFDRALVQRAASLEVKTDVRHPS